MRNYLELGSAPIDEPCVQISNDIEYLEAMREEVKKYKKLLEELFNGRPKGTSFEIKSFAHDFGRYYEVVLVYDDENEQHEEFAYHIEDHLPFTWAG